MTPLERWSDGRLEDRFRDFERRFDDVDRRLGELGPMPKAVAVLSVELKAVSRKLDELAGHPAAEARQSKQTLRAAVIASIVSSGVLAGLTMLLGGPIHP